ncbi:MAG: alpha/beta hydrolase [Ramlibacter sp.]
MRVFSWSWFVLALGMLAGCFPRGDISRPIPTELAAAPVPAKRLVVVLPGRGDDIADLRRSGIVQAVQSVWPDADVILTGLALGFYLEGQPDQRLQAEVIAPARQRGYAQVWLLGASLGGMGALLHDRAYPGSVDGLVLLAPYLGEEPVLREIAAAGGVASWKAPPAAAVLNADNVQRELWRHLQTWRATPARAANVWLAWGKADRFRESMPLLVPLLPSSHVLVREGGHDWETWSGATREILAMIDARKAP